MVTGKNKVGFVFGSLGFGVGVVGEEGDAATVGRPPPSSPVSFSRGLRRKLQSKREHWLRRETRKCQRNTLSLKFAFVCW